MREQLGAVGEDDTDTAVRARRVVPSYLRCFVDELSSRLVGNQNCGAAWIDQGGPPVRRDCVVSSAVSERIASGCSCESESLDDLQIVTMAIPAKSVAGKITRTDAAPVTVSAWHSAIGGDERGVV
jgi:hypothetical protein